MQTGSRRVLLFVWSQSWKEMNYCRYDRTADGSHSCMLHNLYASLELGVRNERLDVSLHRRDAMLRCCDISITPCVPLVNPVYPV